MIAGLMLIPLLLVVSQASASAPETTVVPTRIYSVLTGTKFVDERFDKCTNVDLAEYAFLRLKSTLRSSAKRIDVLAVHGAETLEEAKRTPRATVPFVLQIDIARNRILVAQGKNLIHDESTDRFPLNGLFEAGKPMDLKIAVRRRPIEFMLLDRVNQTVFRYRPNAQNAVFPDVIYCNADIEKTGYMATVIQC